MKSTILVATAVILTMWAAPAGAGLLDGLLGGLLPDPPSGPTPTPEISPASVRGAWALVVGGLLILGDRLRRR